MSQTDRRVALRKWDQNVNFDYDGLKLAALVAILDELKTLNSVFRCPNFLRIPHDLKAIKRNTTKKLKPRK